MAKYLAPALLLLFICIQAQAQTYSFKCITEAAMQPSQPDSCEGCDVWGIVSRSFDGLLIYEDGTPYKWIEIPYTLKVRGDTVDIWEHTSPPSTLGLNYFFPDRVSITVGETDFLTVAAMVDSIFCNAHKGGNLVEIDGDTTNEIQRIDTFSVSNDTLRISLSKDTVPASYVLLPVINILSGTGIGVVGSHGVFTISNTGDLSSTNEIQRIDTLDLVGNILRISLLNDGVPFSSLDLSAFAGTGTVTSVAATAPAAGLTISGSPITTSGTFVFALANDLAALEALSGTGIAARSGTDTWALRTITAGTGISVTNGTGAAGNPTVTNTAPDQVVTLTGGGITSISGTYPSFTITSTEAQTLSLSTNTLSISGGNSVSLAAYANPAATNGLSDNESSEYRLGSRWISSSDGPFAATRKINVNAFSLIEGDATDSLLLVVNGTSDKVGIGIASPSQRLHIAGSGGVYIQVGTSSAVANSGIIFDNTGDGLQTWAMYRQNDGDLAFAIDNTQSFPNGSITEPFIITAGAVPNNSFFMDASGNIELNGTAPARRLDVNGEVRIRDLTTTTATLIVGADSNGDLQSISIGSGLNITGNSLSVSGGGYTTMRDDGTNLTQRTALNFTASTRITTQLFDDPVNNETEVFLDIATNSIGANQIRQANAKSVIGNATNALANTADITASAGDQVLVVNTGNTAISWSTVNTNGITASAVTYAKMQNAVGNNVLLGNNNGANTVYEELTVANIYTLLGLTGTANRFALWTGTNTLGSDDVATFDAANDRVTFTSQTPSFGSGVAIVNITNAGADGTGEFLRMEGSITGNLLAGMYNTNTGASATTIYTISQAGNSSGDAYIQTQISGTGGVVTSFGIDNSDANKWKLSPNQSQPGASADKSFVVTNDAIPLWGINKDAPAYVLDVGGQVRATMHIGTNAAPTVSGSLGSAMGTGGVVNYVVGTNNGFQVQFTTGTTPSASADLFKLTLAQSYPGNFYPVFSQQNDNAMYNIGKIYISNIDPGSLTLAVGTTALPANTQITLNFCLFGK